MLSNYLGDQYFSTNTYLSPLTALLFPENIVFGWIWYLEVTYPKQFYSYHKEIQQEPQKENLLDLLRLKQLQQREICI